MNLWYYIEVIQDLRNLGRGRQAATDSAWNSEVCLCPMLPGICPESSSSEILFEEMPGEGSKSQVRGEKEITET